MEELLSYNQQRGEGGQGMRGDSDGRTADSGTGDPRQGGQPALSDGRWLNWASDLDV